MLIEEDEKGAILPLLVVFAVPLIAIVGLAIDVGLVLSAKNQQELLTRHVALAALSQYIASVNECKDAAGVEVESSAVRSCAVDQAVQRAKMLAKANVNLVNPKLVNPNHSTPDYQYFNSAMGEPQGLLEIGKYYLNKNDESCPGNVGPCFIPASDRNSTDINAVRFTTNVSANPVRTYFLKLIGIESASFTASAIATLIPRNDWFGVDLSPSIVADNYWSAGVLDATAPGGKKRGSRSLYAFPLVDAAVPNFVDNSTIATICNESATSGALCPIEAEPDKAGIWGPDSASSTGMYYSSSVAPSLADDYMHFRSEYYGFNVTFDPDNNDISRKWLIHRDSCVTFPDVNGVDTTSCGDALPQPLFSALSAVRSGMKILADRNMSSDSLFISGFESEGTNFTSGQGTNISFPLRSTGLVHPSHNASATVFKRFYDAMDTSAGTGFITDIGFFPRIAANTDIQAALYNGLTDIAEDRPGANFKYAKNSIFIFTDGFSTCPHNTVVNAEGQVSIPPINKADYYDIINDCDNYGRNVLLAIQNIVDPLFIEQFVKRKIAVNFALLGTSGGAHFIARASKLQSGCMGMGEANASDYLSLVDAEKELYESWYASDAVFGTTALDNALKAASANAPFLYINRLYEIVKATKGMWIPILPQAFTSVNGAMVPLKFENDLNSKCDALRADGREGEALKGGDEEGDSAVDINLKDAVTGRNVMDGKGRVFFDPKGRTIEQQMTEAMEQVLSSPFVLAE